MLKEFYTKYKNPLLFIGVAIIVYFLYFHNLWAYHLMDIDETRYVGMSHYMYKTKDFMTLYLNGEYFFEKPPLYFWLENLSFWIFNAVNEFTARVPVALGAILSAVGLFFVTKKYTNNFKWALISALILLSSFEFLVLGKIAILDSLLAVTATLSVLCGFMTFKTEKTEKMLYWWGFYLFSAIAVMAKGIPGVAIPFGTMFILGIYSKKFKEYFNPKYILPGLIIFSAIAIPWHIIMLKQYDPLFFNEYIMKHHILRFLGSEVVNRTEPVWFFIPVILIGIMPYLASFIAMITEKLAQFKQYKFVWFSDLDEKKQFLALNFIAALVVFLFFSSSGGKLATYIVPIYPFLAVLLANYWAEYIDDNEHLKGIKISTMIFNILLIVAGVAFPIVIYFIQEPIKSDLLTILLPVLITTIVFPILGLIALKKDNRMLLFTSYLLLMTFLSGFGLHKILEMDYRFGQNDLMEYAKYAKENNLNIYTFESGVRYSIMYYSEKQINFNIPLEDISKVLDNKNNIVIVRNKHFPETPDGIKVLKKGRKYSIFVK